MASQDGENAIVLLVKYERTTLFLPVGGQITAKQLKEAILAALIDSQQETPEQLGRPLNEATLDDIEVFRGDATQEEPAYEALTPETSLADLGLSNSSVIYVGFRPQGQDAPAHPVVHLPTYEEEIEE